MDPDRFSGPLALQSKATASSAAKETDGMDNPNRASTAALGRRGFLKTGAGGRALRPALSPTQATARPLTEKEKLARIASNTWPIRYIFKSRTGFGRNPK